jgi:NAD(P)-dependent dehydrogenase (short-subunit alcohol dehydrogenase family)
VRRQREFTCRRPAKGGVHSLRSDESGVKPRYPLARISLAPGIRVNAVAAGLVDSPLTADWTRAQQLWKERAPMCRAAHPEDIAQAIAFLVASNYLTGEILLSEGG